VVCTCHRDPNHTIKQDEYGLTLLKSSRVLPSSTTRESPLVFSTMGEQMLLLVDKDDH
jgi:hypothetical protein